MNDGTRDPQAVGSRTSDIGFTPSVKARQDRHGSRAHFDAHLGEVDWLDHITDNLKAFLATRESFYLATVSETGHPYIQHRGGPPGFLQVLDDKTLAFADFAGNRQYITAGHLDGNDRVHLFFMDYANSQRIKLWGRARLVEDDPDLLQRLMPDGYQARPERAMVITVEAWDPNCPQHIPALYPEEVVRQVATKLNARIAALEAENRELRRWVGTPSVPPSKDRS